MGQYINLEEIMENCDKYCGSCEIYKTVKEMDAKCETKKERGRAARRAIYRAKKRAKLNKQE